MMMVMPAENNPPEIWQSQNNAVNLQADIRRRRIMIITKEKNRRKLPAGIQSFKKIREENFLYVDKTDIIWNLANNGDQYNYLSRPRRFGKSVLVDTLQAYFEGRKDLFEGLKIMQLEDDWTQYPVIRLDMSKGGANATTLRSYLDIRFGEYEDMYNIIPKATAQLADRFHAIITSAYKKTGLKVVILIDEYDSPLQHSWKTPDHEACTEVYREVFAILKSDDEYEQFVFITGITKFTQVSLFSTLNNLTNISFDPEYAALCGITEEEISDNFQPELAKMAEKNKWTQQETHEHLKEYYDGYHFSDDNMIDIYNPFSLIHALSKSKLRSYWISSGATSLLPKFVNDAEIHMQDFEDCLILRNTLETSDVTDGGPELFLYQSGYLTIKSYEEGVYHLGFPNEEVKQALYECVLPALTMRKEAETQSLQAQLQLYLQTHDTDKAMKALKALIADVPYSNKKLASMDMEERYRLIICTILNAIGLKVEVEHMLATGRIDILVHTSRYIYVIELKLQKNGGKEAGIQQIINNQYLEPFKADKRQAIGLAIELDDMGKGLLDWKETE